MSRYGAHGTVLSNGQVAASLTRYLFCEGDVVLSYGQWNDTMFLVLSGWLQVPQ